jgi:uncharacterized membrane protein
LISSFKEEGEQMLDLTVDDKASKHMEKPGAMTRVASLDIVRGIAMILMAIDHGRVYSGVPAGGPTFGVFYTRWITNFVAPAFVFLAGTSAYLYGRKCLHRTLLSKFLAVRGVWLIILELTILRVAWTFNFDFKHYLLAGVIWMIGWSMIALSGAIYLPTTFIAIIGISLIALHNVTDFFRPQLIQAFGSDGPNWLLRLLYFGGGFQIGKSGPPLYILYVLVPWVGLMFAGYAFGPITERGLKSRQRIYFWLGTALSGLFLVLRVAGIYGDPRPWDRHGVFSFLNTTKYPASLEYLLMTIGPMFIMWALAERWEGRLASIIETFGRVPMFYYLLHIPLIHLAACVVSLIREGRVDPWLFTNHPVAPGRVPTGYTWSLGLLYFVYVVCLSLLYLPCRWFAEKKSRRMLRRNPELSSNIRLLLAPAGCQPTRSNPTFISVLAVIRERYGGIASQGTGQLATTTYLEASGVPDIYSLTATVPGNGDGTFTAAPSPSSDLPGAIAVGHFNGDDIPIRSACLGWVPVVCL